MTIAQSYDSRQCAARGAVLLDGVKPGWAARVDRDRLAMEWCDRCILGQLYGDFDKGFRTLCLKHPLGVPFSASKFGFTIPDVLQKYTPVGVAIDCFRRLADAWRSEIAQRLPEGPRP